MTDISCGKRTGERRKEHAGFTPSRPEEGKLRKFIIKALHSRIN